MRRRECWTGQTIFRSPPKTGLRNSKARSQHRTTVLLKTLFHPDSYWRDVLALSWNIQTINGADAILKELKAARPQRRARRLSRSIPTAPRRAR